ncbi:hypothetical protein C8R43DRAFT_1128198 [Mycena crocata]|nr:hypothetical protein C8R43DRAFT_1128198 [Mycena crocata]
MHPQGVNSSTFTPQPLDGSLTIPQLLDVQSIRSPNHTAYIYDDPGGTICRVSFRQYIRTVHAACRRVLNDINPGENTTVVGIFAVTDTISYCMLVAAMLRAGIVPFCISPRTAADSLANMLEKTNAVAIYVSSDTRSRNEVSEGLALYKRNLPIFEPPSFEALQSEVGSDAELPPLPPICQVSLQSTAVILHSSGSTAKFSKPVPFTHQILLQAAAIPWSGTEDYCGQVFGAHNLPNYHGMGLRLGLWPFSSGLTVAVLRPATPPMPRTAENSLNGMLTTKPDHVMSIPNIIEIWSKDAAVLKVLQSLKSLIYAGAPLNKRVGDFLATSGVHLCSGYGAMETGGPVTSVLVSHGKDWDYFSLRDGIETVRVPEDDGSGRYTLVYFASPVFTPCYTTTEIGGRAGCALNDVLEQHPENPRLHRVYGRKDDIIVFSTAAKMMPGPVEARLKDNLLVDSAVIFGRGQTHPGVIIQLKTEFHDDLLDAHNRAKILDALWVSVDEANSTSPNGFQISRDMVVLADPEKPFALTGKLEPRKAVVFEQYRQEIEAVYH